MCLNNRKYITIITNEGVKFSAFHKDGASSNDILIRIFKKILVNFSLDQPNSVVHCHYNNGTYQMKNYMIWKRKRLLLDLKFLTEKLKSSKNTTYSNNLNL